MSAPLRVASALILRLPLLLSPPAAALELQGQTWFSRPPWRVVFRNYYWYVMQTGGSTTSPSPCLNRPGPASALW